MKTRERIAIVLAALVTLVSPHLARGADADRRLADVLLDLRASGLDIIFSEELVRPEMRVPAPTATTRARPPRAFLDEVLAPHGLRARRGPGGRLLIVKAAAGGRSPGTGEASAATEIRLLIRLAGAAPPAGLAVSIPERSLTLHTGAEGTVAFPVTPGLYRLDVHLEGHHAWSVDGIVVTPGRATDVTVALDQDPSAPGQPTAAEVILTVSARDRYSDTVEVSSQPASAPDAGAREMPVAAVKAAPGAFENVFRTLPLLPGVTPANEVQSRFSVRGGAPEQNLTVADGVEVYNPFRMEAMVSAFLPETIDSFDFSTGLMSARHGDRLSSVLEVRSRSGDPQRRLRGTVAASLSDANLVLEGRLPGKRNASWLLAGRRTYYDLVVERFAGGDLPGFRDFQLSLRWPFGERSSLVLRGQRAGETAATPDSVEEPEGVVSDSFGHRSLDERWAATLDLGLGRTLTSSTTLSSYRNPQDSFHAMADPWDPLYDRHNRIGDLALRQRFVRAASASRRFEAGFELHRLDTSWNMQGGGDLPSFFLFRGPSLALNSWGSRGDLFETVDLRGSQHASRWGAWLQGDLALAQGLSVQPGLRLERSTINGDMRLLPRLSAVWRPGAANRVFAGLGWFAQSPGFEKTVLSDTFLDFSGPRPLPLRSESARQVVLGVERDLSAGWLGRAELYHRRLDDLIVGRLETEEGRQQRLASYVIPPDFPGGPPLDPLITTTPVNDGWGTARGFELSLLRRPASASASLGGMLSYSYGVANRHSYGLTYPFDYDRRHAFTATLDWRASRSLAFSAAWRGATGLPYTPARPAVSFGLQETPGEPPLRVPSRWVATPGPTMGRGPFAYDVGPGSLSDLNSARHPFYSRVDFRALFQPGGPRGRWEVYLDVYNALNADLLTHQNGPGFQPEAVWDGTRWRVVHSQASKFVLPSFGLRFRF